MREAAALPYVAEIAISTRPDCITSEYLDVLQRIRGEHDIGITIELGLQTTNCHTLASISRGHTLAEFIDAVLAIRQYGFEICAHVILNLPGDDMLDTIETSKVLSALRIPVVKIHSLYIAKNTQLCDDYENGTITLCSKEEYLERLMASWNIWIPQLPSRGSLAAFQKRMPCSAIGGTSWWKLRTSF